MRTVIDPGNSFGNRQYFFYVIPYKKEKNNDFYRAVAGLTHHYKHTSTGSTYNIGGNGFDSFVKAYKINFQFLFHFLYF